MELTQAELEFLAEALQRDATDLLIAGGTQKHPTYIANRNLFGKVWDALDALESKEEGDL